MEFQTLKHDLKSRMDKTIDALKKEFMGLRTGRASVNLLDPIMVEAYGSTTPLNQVASINVPESRLLTVSVWDKSLVTAVEKAIRESDLGLNPASEGQLIRIPLPALTEERRQELSKVAAKYTEQARIGIRGVRHDGMDSLKKMEKDGHISEDEQKQHSEEIQKLTDDAIKTIDQLLETKTKEITTI